MSCYDEYVSLDGINYDVHRTDAEGYDTKPYIEDAEGYRTYVDEDSISSFNWCDC